MEQNTESAPVLLQKVIRISSTLGRPKTRGSSFGDSQTHKTSPPSKCTITPSQTCEFKHYQHTGDYSKISGERRPMRLIIKAVFPLLGFPQATKTTNALSSG